MVDEPIYNRLPGFLIATVDKFAAMPWKGEVAKLFGRVKSFEPGRRLLRRLRRPPEGIELDHYLPPPELVIQDELHLISGPLGTVAGLYETAIDHLCRDRQGRGPKIVSSTATVRRAQEQIRALFGRTSVQIFPPPGPDRRDSFFAETVTDQVVGPVVPGRRRPGPQRQAGPAQDLPGPDVGRGQALPGQRRQARSPTIRPTPT